MNQSDGREVLAQLLRAYEEEARLYAGLEKAAAEQREVLLNGGDPGRLRLLVERQRVLAERIGRIESGIAPLRDFWERIRDAQHDPGVRRLGVALDRLLEDLAERIHHIVTIERENSEALLAAAPYRG